MEIVHIVTDEDRWPPANSSRS